MRTATEPAVGRHVVGNALVLHSGEKISHEAQSLALAVEPDADNDIVVLDLQGDVPVQVWESVARSIDRSRRGIRLVVCGAGVSVAMFAGQWLADRLKRTVVAPHGHTIRGTAGSLFVHDDAGGGWIRHRPRRSPVWEAKRYPPPPWDAAAAEFQETSAVGAAEPLPGGVWLRDSRDAEATARHWSWLSSSLPCQPDALTVVVGCPGTPPLPLDDINRFWRQLPTDDQRRARFVHYGPVRMPAGAVLGQTLADLLQAPVACFTGIPVGNPERPQMHTAALHGGLGWQVFARELGFLPTPAGGDAPPPQILSYRAPKVFGAPVEPMVYQYAKDAVVEIIQSGLWVRGPSAPPSAARIRERTPDPTTHALIYDDTDPATASRMRALGEDLVARLDPATRTLSTLLPASHLIAAAAAQENLTEGEIDFKQTSVFTAADLGLPAELLRAAAPPAAAAASPAAVASPAVVASPAAVASSAVAASPAAVATPAAGAASPAVAASPAAAAQPAAAHPAEGPTVARPLPDIPVLRRASPRPAHGILTLDESLKPPFDDQPAEPGHFIAEPAEPVAAESALTATDWLSPMPLWQQPVRFAEAAAAPVAQEPAPAPIAEPVAATSFAEPVAATSFAEPVAATSFAEPSAATSFAEPSAATSFAEPPPRPEPIAVAPFAEVDPAVDVAPLRTQPDLPLLPRRTPGDTWLSAEGQRLLHQNQHLERIRPSPQLVNAWSTYRRMSDLVAPPAEEEAWISELATTPVVDARLGEPVAEAWFGESVAPPAVMKSAEGPTGPVVLDLPAGRHHRAEHERVEHDRVEHDRVEHDRVERQRVERQRGEHRRQPVPDPDARGLPTAAGMTDERTWLRRSFAREFDAAASSVARILAEHPRLNDGDPAEAMSDAVAVRLYLSEAGDGLDKELRSGTIGGHVPFARCVAAGLSRLPTYRGACLLRAAVDPADLDAFVPGDELTDWSFVNALAGLAPELPGVDVMIWAMSARRTRVLEPDSAYGVQGRVVFLPGTTFKVLAVDPERLLLREMSPDENPASRTPFDDLAVSALRQCAERWTVGNPYAEVGPAAEKRFCALPGTA